MDEMKIYTIKGEVRLDSWPDHCPFCHKSIVPHPLFGYTIEGSLEALFACPDNTCKKSFIGYYRWFSDGRHYAYYKDEVSSGNLKPKLFSDNITQNFPVFVQIYNQAYVAEQIGLTEICGVGYRKALEFLVKDYCILKNPEREQEIKNSLLGKVITEFVDDVKIKNVSKRAVWLGNDETHYVKRWEGKSLSDLKDLIDLTLHWIEAEVLTERIEKEMN